MNSKVMILFCFVLTPVWSQQTITTTPKPSAAFLEFLSEFNLQTEQDKKDYDIIKYHALQDLKEQPSKESQYDR